MKYGKLYRVGIGRGLAAHVVYIQGKWCSQVADNAGSRYDVSFCIFKCYRKVRNGVVYRHTAINGNAEVKQHVSGHVDKGSGGAVHKTVEQFVAIDVYVYGWGRTVVDNL